MTPATPSPDTTRRAKFASRLNSLPTRRGVYIMRNEKGDVIYGGNTAEANRLLFLPTRSGTQANA